MPLHVPRKITYLPVGVEKVQSLIGVVLCGFLCVLLHMQFAADRIKCRYFSASTYWLKCFVLQTQYSRWNATYHHRYGLRVEISRCTASSVAY